MLGNLNMAPHDEPIFTSKDFIVYTAAMLGNTTTNAKGPSQVAADAPGHLDNGTASSYNFFDNTDDAADPSFILLLPVIRNSVLQIRPHLE